MGATRPHSRTPAHPAPAPPPATAAAAPVTLKMGIACLPPSRLDHTSARQICMPNSTAEAKDQRSPMAAGAPLSSSRPMPTMDAATAAQAVRLSRASPSTAAMIGVTTTARGRGAGKAAAGRVSGLQLARHAACGRGA